MEENTIIEEGIDKVFDEVGNPVGDTLTDLPTIVEESGNGDIQILPLAIGVAIGGAIILGVKKLWKMAKTKRYLTPCQVDKPMEETEDIDEEEEEE